MAKPDLGLLTFPFLDIGARRLQWERRLRTGRPGPVARSIRQDRVSRGIGDRTVQGGASVSRSVIGP